MEPQQKSREALARPPNQVIDVPLEMLHPFQGSPFGIRDDEQMQEMTESIRASGVLIPALVRPAKEGGYEMIAGHRRKHACELLGLATLPVLVREMTDDAAIIAMADSNLQRENILPSERAFAYRMKLEAMKRQGARNDLSGTAEEKGTESAARLGKENRASGRQVQRYVRLTHLIPELLQRVDEKRLGFYPAVELSYLAEQEQRDLLEALEVTQSTPSLSQAQRIRKLSQEGNASPLRLQAIMSEEKKPEVGHLSLRTDSIRKYFPSSYTTRQMQQTIIKLLESWSRRRQQTQER